MEVVLVVVVMVVVDFCCGDGVGGAGSLQPESRIWYDWISKWVSIDSFLLASAVSGCCSVCM